MVREPSTMAREFPAAPRGPMLRAPAPRVPADLGSPGLRSAPGRGCLELPAGVSISSASHYRRDGLTGSRPGVVKIRPLQAPPVTLATVVRIFATYHPNQHRTRKLARITGEISSGPGVSPENTNKGLYLAVHSCFLNCPNLYLSTGRLA